MPTLSQYIEITVTSVKTWSLFNHYEQVVVFNSDTELNAVFSSDLQRFWHGFDFNPAFTSAWLSFITETLKPIRAFSPDKFPDFIEFLRSTAALFDYTASLLSNRSRADGMITISLADEKISSFSLNLSKFINGLCCADGRFDFKSAIVICDAIAQYQGAYVSTEGSGLFFKDLTRQLPEADRHDEIMELLTKLQGTWQGQWYLLPIFPARLFESMLLRAACAHEALLSNLATSAASAGAVNATPVVVESQQPVAQLKYSRELAFFQLPLPSLAINVQQAVAMLLSLYDPTQTIDQYLRTYLPTTVDAVVEDATVDAAAPNARYWQALAEVVSRTAIANNHNWPRLATALVDYPLTPVMSVFEVHPILLGGRMTTPGPLSISPIPETSPRQHFYVDEPAIRAEQGVALMAFSPTPAVTAMPDLDETLPDDEAELADVENVAKHAQLIRVLGSGAAAVLANELHSQNPAYFLDLLSSTLRMQALLAIYRSAGAHFTYAASGFYAPSRLSNPYHTRLFYYLMGWENTLTKLGHSGQLKKLKALMNFAQSTGGHRMNQLIHRVFVSLLFNAEMKQSGVLSEQEAKFYQQLFSFLPKFGLSEERSFVRIHDLTVCLQANPELLSLAYELLKRLWGETNLMARTEFEALLPAMDQTQAFVQSIITKRGAVPKSLLPPSIILHTLFDKFEISGNLSEKGLARLGQQAVEDIRRELSSSLADILGEAKVIAYTRACLHGIADHSEAAWKFWEAWKAERRNKHETVLTPSDEQSLKNCCQILTWAVNAYELEQASACSKVRAQHSAYYLFPLATLAGFSTALYYVIQHILKTPNEDDKRVMIEGYSLYAVTGLLGIAQVMLYFFPRWRQFNFTSEVAHLFGKADPNRRWFITLTILFALPTLITAALFTFGKVVYNIDKKRSGDSGPPTDPASLLAEDIGFPSMMAFIFVGSLFVANSIAIGIITGVFRQAMAAVCRSKPATRPAVEVEGINTPLVAPGSRVQRAASVVGPATGLRTEHPTAAEVHELPQMTGFAGLPPADGSRPVNRRLLAALSDDDSSVASSV